MEGETQGGIYQIDAFSADLQSTGSFGGRADGNQTVTHNPVVFVHGVSHTVGTMMKEAAAHYWSAIVPAFFHFTPCPVDRASRAHEFRLSYDALPVGRRIVPSSANFLPDHPAADGCALEYEIRVISSFLMQSHHRPEGGGAK